MASTLVWISVTALWCSQCRDNPSWFNLAGLMGTSAFGLVGLADMIAGVIGSLLT